MKLSPKLLLLSVILFASRFEVLSSFAQESRSAAATPDITEIIIKGAPVQMPLKEVPASGTVFSAERLQELGIDHFQNVIDSVPNLNWAAGTNRPRFFQIRGIGELEQYEGAPNPSVGLLVDGVDFSGIGAVATLFDVDQVEVLRGPQSIRYGANALAGVINLHSTDPTEETSGRLELSAGSDDLGEGGAAIGGPVDGSDSKLLFRVSAYQHYSDGFRENVFLDRDNTNKRDETTTRAKLRWLASDDVTADLSLLFVDLDNGYDAFAIDNSLTTQSDRPGKDAQISRAAAFKLKINLPDQNAIESISTVSNSDINYSYDGDWGNNPFWGQFAPYDYFSQTYRNRDIYSQEFRIYSDHLDYRHGESWRWLTGMFAQRLAEDAEISQYSNNEAYDQLVSDYTAKTSAAFGQLEAPLLPGSSLTLGLRAENRDSHYFDSQEARFEPNENMFGGSVSFNHDLGPNVRSYALISRGFKGGGFNANPNVPIDRREYTPEYLWNYEVGLKGQWFNHKLQANLAAFYDDRHDVQIKLALQNDPSDPLAFTYLTDNAAGGRNYGLEADTTLQLTPKLSFVSSGALLSTEFSDFSYPGLSLSGREQAQSPTWQYSIGPRYALTQNMFVAAIITGRDSFYFDDSNDQKSKPYHLLNLSMGYRTARWAWTVWARNVLDKEYAVRGFYFGDEPPDFPNKLYVQQGDPRQIGTTLSFWF